MLDRGVIRDDVSLEAPWALVEQFAGREREEPEDVNRGADMIAGALSDLGIPVTVYEPVIYLSLPISASVTAGDATFAAIREASALVASV